MMQAIDQSTLEHHQLPWQTTKIDEKVQIRFGTTGISATKPQTIFDIFNQTLNDYGSNPALKYQDAEKNWQTITFQEYNRKIRTLAKIFIKLGFKSRDSIGILAFNCPEWFYSSLAAIAAGGVIAGIYTTNSSEAVKHVLETAGCTICIVENKKQMDKIKLIKSKLPNLKTVIQINGPFDDDINDNKDDNGYYKWSDIEGKFSIDDDNDDDDACNIELEKRLSAIVPNECCSLIFTSGTTGKPKGVMLSHDNVVYGIKAAALKFEDLKYGEEVLISYLPLNHIAAQFIDMFLPILLAGCVYFADRDALKGTLIKTMIKARPTRFLGVPRVWEKFHEKMITVEAKTSGFNMFLLNFAKKMVYNYHISRINGGHGNFIAYKIGQQITNKVKAGMGFDRCRTFLTGAAPTNIETKRFFCSIDILLYEAYGLSESGPVALNDSTMQNFETIGHPCEGCEIIINNPDEKGVGEIFIKGRSIFMGYLKEPLKTEESFDNDWYKTGDLGRIDCNGDLYIVGRVKELIITAGGENVPFVYIEETVKNELPGISNAFVVGDKKKFLTILLTIKTEMDPETGRPLDKLQYESLKWMQELELKHTTLSEILNAGPCPVVLQSIQDGIDRFNKKALSNVQTIKKFAILPHDFSMATEELGPTLKLKRNVVIDLYRDIIDKFYE